VAIPVNHEPKQEPYLNSDDARGLEPSSGLDVIHHSAAFELGRLLAMSDPKFIDSLSRWRNLWNKKQEKKKYREDLVLESALDLDHERMHNENVSIQSTIQKGILTNSSAKYEPLLEKVEGKLETRMGNEVSDFDEAQFKVIGTDMELPEHINIASPEAVEVMLKEQLTRGGENLARR
tara:strand:- start:58 stop:591 length:534 start_codon:yes stop_codon:yes gene_type:complete